MHLALQAVVALALRVVVVVAAEVAVAVAVAVVGEEVGAAAGPWAPQLQWPVGGVRRGNA